MSAALQATMDNKYAPLFPTPHIGMEWACCKYRQYFAGPQNRDKTHAMDSVLSSNIYKILGSNFIWESESVTFLNCNTKV